MKNYVVFEEHITLIIVFRAFCNSLFISHSLVVKISLNESLLMLLVFVQFSSILFILQTMKFNALKNELVEKEVLNEELEILSDIQTIKERKMNSELQDA